MISSFLSSMKNHITSLSCRCQYDAGGGSEAGRRGGKRALDNPRQTGKREIAVRGRVQVDTLL